MTTVHMNRDQLREVLRTKKGSKYRNQITFVDKQRFDSKREAQRYRQLKLLEKAGIISDLKLQVPFTFKVKRKELRTEGNRVFKYIADFTYTLESQPIVEDCKGMRTSVYKIKRMMMREINGIDILET